MPNLTESDLAHCTGTEQWYRHWMNRHFLFTDGIKTMADKGEAYWLIDAIFSHQSNPKLRTERLQYFQLWQLKVNADKTAVLTCRGDSSEPVLVEQKIEFTDFPLDEIKLYAEGDGEHLILLLPSEH